MKAFPALVSGWPANPVIVSGTGLSMRKMQWAEAHSWSRTNTFAPVSNKAWIVVGPSGVSSLTSLINRLYMTGSRNFAFLLIPVTVLVCFRLRFFGVVSSLMFLHQGCDCVEDIFVGVLLWECVSPPG